MVNWLPLGFGAVVVLFGLLIFSAGVARLRSWNALRSIAAGGVTEPGIAEITGEARPFEEAVNSPPAGLDSLIYRYERERRRRDSGTGPDDAGTRWETVESESDRVPFVVAADGRDIVVDPGGADLLLEAETTRSGGERHSSSRLGVGEPVYVAGTVYDERDADFDSPDHRYVLEQGGSTFGGGLSGLLGSPFVISDSDESEAERRLLKGSVGSLVLGLVFVGFGAVFVLVGVGGG